MSKRAIVGVVDVGLGNITAISNMISYVGASPELISSGVDCGGKDLIIIPGVSHYDELLKRLKLHEFAPFFQLVDSGKVPTKILGICSGYHVLCLGSEESNQSSKYSGFGFFNQHVSKLIDSVTGRAITHNSWRDVELSATRSKERFYFNHSFGVLESRSSSVITNYVHLEALGMLAASAEKGNIFGTQFHPEKSGKSGLEFLARIIA